MDCVLAQGSPGKLKHNLNINVAALIPGGGIISKKDVDRKNSLDTVDTDTLPESKSDVVIKNVERRQETSNTSDSESRILTNITKDRAKIPVKRRPSTRKARQEAIRNSIADFRINVSDVDEHRTTPPPELAEKEPDSARRNSYTSSNLFDDADDFENLFGSVKSSSKSGVAKKSLFDDDDDDEDIFGHRADTIVKQTAKPGVLKDESKKQPKAAQITKLENTAVTDDPLSLFQE